MQPASSRHEEDRIRGLGEVLGLPAGTRLAVRAVATVLPFRTNTYVTEQLIDWASAPDDPIYRLVFPQPDMLPAGDTERLGDLRHFVGRVHGALADQHRDFLPGVQDRGCAVEVLVAGQHPWTFVARARVDRAVLVGRLLDRLGFLEIIGDDQRGDGALGQRDPAGAVDQMADLSRNHRHLDVLVGDVLEQGLEVDLLLVVAAEARPRLLAEILTGVLLRQIS